MSSPGPVGMKGNPQADHYVPFFQQTDGRVVQRDIFPLPSCGPRSMLGGSDVCRSVQRRLQKACHIDSMVEDCICALNAMYSNGRVEKAKTGSALSLAQCEVVRHLRNSMQMLGPCPQGLTGAEAVSQLRAFDGYGEDQCPASIAAYSPELLSLPSKGNCAVALDRLLGDDGQTIVSEFTRSRLLDKNEARSRLAECGLRQCYTDPALRDPRTFGTFVKRLRDADLVEFTLEPGVERIECFFVGKKDGRIRMVIDCRRANCWFHHPDKVHLCTAEALSRIQLDEGQSLYVSTADLKDAFYHFELPTELRPFFTMRGVAAGEVGVSESGKIAVTPGQKIYPRLKVLPMGWSHALWWCQVIHQRIVSTIGATSLNCLEDKAAAPSSRCCHLEYVDNFVVIGTSEDEVGRMADSGVNALRSKGLVVHEEEKSSQQIAVLGWEFDYSIFKPKSKRVWRVRRAFEYFLNKGMISGRQLEKVVGHATFLCLGRRESLAVFGETYTFIHRNYH